MQIKVIKVEDTWALRHEVMWPTMPFDFVKLPEDEKGTHFGLFKKEELISVISLFETAPGVAQFRKFATKETEQGKGYGSKLLKHLIDFAQNQRFKTLWCNARVDKTDFYINFGMFETEETYVKQNLKFVILKKVL